MSLFESYERECEYALNEATKKIASLGVVSGLAKDKITREIEDELARAQRSIDSMGQMAQNARASEGYGVRIQQKQSSLARVKVDFERSLNLGRGREDLFGGTSRGSDWGRQDAMMRDGMNVQRTKLEGVSDNLNRAHQMAEETNQIGVNTLNDLRRQREVLIGAQGGMTNIEEKTGTARRVLTMMRRRVIGNKLILGFIIFILLVGNALIIYFKWGYKKNKNNSPPSAPSSPPTHPAPVQAAPVPVLPPPVPVAPPVPAPAAAPSLPPSLPPTAK
jgi:vesicle transport through interaction with t-SNAREs protein 1